MRIGDMKTGIDRQFADLKADIDRRFEAVDRRFDVLDRQWDMALDIRERLAALEARLERR